MIYFLIFFQKIIENALSSFRAIVYTAGHKHIGALLIAINTVFWLYIVTIIIHDLTDDPIKVLIYALGQFFGVYIGMVIEKRMAIGKSLLYVILGKENEENVTQELREKGYGVTCIEAKGYDDNVKSLLLIVCKRKNKDTIRDIIKKFESEVVIMSKNPSNFTGGYVN
jgi:uncharacterized protein YebE (UPF0316 family)